MCLCIHRVHICFSQALIGRDVELVRLLELMSMSQQGLGQATVLTGAAGAGKSALVRTLIGRVRSMETKKTRVLLAQCSATMKTLEPLYTCRHVTSGPPPLAAFLTFISRQRYILK